MSWDEIMKDPEYNKQMQAVVQSRLKSAKGAEEALGKMAPAIEVMARKYGLDAKNMDYDALAKAINDDDAYYEDKALEMGVSVETAKRVDQMERNTERQKAQEQRTLQEQALQQHFISLERQGEELKKVFPNFDLRKELQNPAFARMTAPGKGIMSVEDAYRAVHRQEIDSAASQIIAQKTAEKISNAI
jgi:DNA-binding transcriptional MerR regulator